MLWGFILLTAAVAILRSVQLLWSSYSDSKRFFSLYNLASDRKSTRLNYSP